MTLVSEQLPNLMNGVSQQAVTMRMASQAELQENAVSSVVEGNIKRPPTKFRAKLTVATAQGAYFHTINRDSAERYSVIADGTGIAVYDVTTGQERSVTYPAGTNYISSTNAALDLRAITVADYTFIVNRKRIVETFTVTAPAPIEEAMLFVKAVNYDVTYKVRINGTEVASYTTDASADADASVSVDEVIEALKAQLLGSLPTGWLFNSYSPILHITKSDNSAFELEFTDDDGNTKTQAITDSIQRFTDLPVVGKRNFLVKVTGDEGSETDDYYLKFIPNNASLTYDSGVWEETTAPGTLTALNPATMPHSLVRMVDGSFELRQINWGRRVVGDVDTSPWPSFVGGTIRDVYFDRRRLCFLGADTVSMSASNDFFNFFAATVITVLDDGPIDVSSPGTSVTSLNYAVLFNKKVLLFSDQRQFVIEDEYLAAGKPPTIKTLSDYESRGDTAPVGAGRTLFFPVNKGTFGAVYEYYVMQDSAETDAAEITEHVPTYIPAPITKVSASESAGMAVVLSSGDPRSIFVYKYHWNGQQKLQSSWSRWTMPEDGVVRSVDFISDELILLTEYADGVYLEVMDLGKGREEEGETIVYHLDRRVDETSVTDLVEDTGARRTTFRLSYETTAPLAVATRVGDGTSSTGPGKNLTVVSQIVDPVGGGTLVTVSGLAANMKFFAGVKYAHKYTFSQPVIKAQSSSGGVASVIAGRLQISRWLVAYAKTGYFRVEVKATGRLGEEYASDPLNYGLTGVTLGNESTILGQINTVQGVLRVPVQAKAGEFSVTLINDTFLPSGFTAAEWEGRYSRHTSGFR